MVDHGCWRSEYDWEIACCQRKTILSVLFDNGAQRQFSSVRISLLLSTSNDVAPEHRTAWQITPCPFSLSVVCRTFAEGRPVLRNDPSLPICHIVFIAGRHSARSQAIGVEIAKLCGEIALAEPNSSGVKLFEVDHPLAENVQSVSFSFTNSYLLSTALPFGVFPNPLLDSPVTVGRVIRIIHMNERRTIPLPTDVLLIIFEHLTSPPTYCGWRQDLVNSALVCREWTCALSLLLIDFRSRNSQHGHPPEINRFAKALAARSHLSIDIKHLSVGYLEKHPAWDPFPELPSDALSPMSLAKLRLLQSPVRRSLFAESFLIILNLAKNVQTLSLDTTNPLAIPPKIFADALSGLVKLDTFDGVCPLTMAQLLFCIATWPSLKYLSLFHVLPPNTRSTALPSLPCHLTELVLAHVSVRDDELACLASASGTTLQRLRLDNVSFLTNTGLGIALSGVCKSLTYLFIATMGIVCAWGEEHALDTTVARMERLTELVIIPNIASERMLERRTDAFMLQRTSAATVLPEVHLQLMVGSEPMPEGGLLSAMEREWPGWKMDVVLS